METEITVEVLDKASNVIEYLVKNGFTVTEVYDINDCYYSKYPLNKLKKMTYKSLIKNSFLLREIIDDRVRYQLCYKDKVIKNDTVISESKYTSLVDNIDNTKKIFKLSGLNMWCETKNHTHCMKKGNIFFAIQEISGLGTFIEYEEDEIMLGMTPEEKIDYMKNILANLNIPLGKDYNVKKVYMLFNKMYKGE